MLSKGYLAGNSIYVSIDHSPNFNGYFDALDGIFKLINECENGRDIKNF